MYINDLENIETNSGNVRYNSETDKIQVKNNEEWIDIFSAGLQAFNIFDTLSADWGYTSDSSGGYGSRSISIGNNLATFSTSNTSGSNNHYTYYRYLRKVNLSNYNFIRLKESFSSSGAYLWFGVNIVNVLSGARTKIAEGYTGNGTSASIDTDVNISKYSGEYYIEVYSNFYGSSNIVTIYNMYMHN